jgi:hypothetical protein
MRTNSEDQERGVTLEIASSASNLMNFRPAVVSALALVALVTTHAANTSRPQAEAFAKKIATINQHADKGGKSPRRTVLTESEVNSWFEFRAQPLLPAGVTNPKVVAIGNGKLLGSAIVDLEAIGKKRGSGGALDLWNLLGGRLPLSVTGILHTKDGKGRFEMQAADVSGVPVPMSLLQELVSYYTRTPDHPQGVKLDAPFDLPAEIKQIEVGQAQAVVIQ